jgi:hypothetical protein
MSNSKSVQISRERHPSASKPVSLDPALVALICAALLYCVSWTMGCSSASSSPRSGGSGGKKSTAARSLPQLTPEDEHDRLVPAVSGRKLTVEKMAQRAATSLQYSNEEYGVAFDAPKGYQLKEGDLPSMDRGLGYLGPIPMHFAAPGGVRLATAEPPAGLHVGTNFVNEFFTLSALYGATETSCAEFSIPVDGRGAAVTRTVDGIEFRGFAEHSAASMHQYSGVYLHTFANDTCYEIGYGVATVGADGAGNLKKIDPEKVLQRMERILDNVRINPPAFERANAAN